MYVAKATCKKMKLQAMTVSCMCILYITSRFLGGEIFLHFHPFKITRFKKKLQQCRIYATKL